jgi:hypothetical protein
MAYSGTYKVKNKAKYEGNWANVKYRSLWERQCFRYLDNNPSVIGWSSEEYVVGYRCRTDNKLHKYYIDLFIRWESNDGSSAKRKCTLVEIKPNKETIAPKQGKRKTKKYLKEVFTYAKNISKWEAAKSFADKRGYDFEIWDEHVIRSMGIKLL